MSKMRPIKRGNKSFMESFDHDEPYIMASSFDESFDS